MVDAGIRVLCLPKYDRKAASCRYRILQFLPFLERQGIECEVHPLFGGEYLDRKFATGKISPSEVGASLARRLKLIWSAENFDAVFMQYELFPYFPGTLLEKMLLRRKLPYIYDYDDAIFHQYDQHPNPAVRFSLKHKIAKVINAAAHVIAGNEYLARFAARVNERVSVLPTVIDLEKYPRQKEKGMAENRLTVGWLGSPSTSAYLKDIAAVLTQFCKETGAVVRLVGAGNIDLEGMHVERRDWSEATEVEEMNTFDIGIMPLTDDPWARGKSGFKLIQYMACGIPVVASPVGANREIVEDGVNGFHAITAEEWMSALKALHGNAELRETMGRAGRRKVEERYCLAVVAPKLEAVIRAVSSGR